MTLCCIVIVITVFVISIAYCIIITSLLSIIMKLSVDLSDLHFMIMPCVIIKIIIIMHALLCFL